MSRSRKKIPVQKDPNNSEGKRRANRTLRRKTHEKTKLIDNEDPDVMPELKEVVDSRDFLDFKIWHDKGDRHGTQK